MEYRCKICDKEIKLLKNHLKNSHKDIIFDDYFKLYPEDKDCYDKYNSLCKEERRCNSPNCIEFYLKRGFSKEESKIKLEEHRSKQPFRIKKDIKPNQIGYWIKKGYSEDIAKEKLSLFQKRDLKSMQEVYGIEDGEKRYKDYIFSLKKRKYTEINNYVKGGQSKEDAEKLYIKRRIFSSPRRKEYWIKKGYSEEDAIKEITYLQKTYSPRRKEYWIKKGYSEEDSIKEISSYQDNNSINSIIDRYNCTIDEAINIQDSFITKMLNTMEERGLIIEKDVQENFYNYTILVWRDTNRNYRLYKNLIKTNGYERSKEFHLDHRFSIYEGFKQGIDYKIISSPENLELIPAIKNLTKRTKCSIKKEELIEKYNKRYEN